MSRAEPSRGHSPPRADAARSTRTLVVWCPDWPVVAAGVEATSPAVVVHANRVVACSEAARTEGVRRGLRRREAQARCPDLVVLEHDPGRDARAFEPLVAGLEAGICPRVEIVRPGVCALATRGPARYFGGDEALAARVRAVVDTAARPRAVVGTAARPRAVVDTAAGGGCRVGIADGRFAAGLAARTATIVPAGHSRGFLAPFPVSTLERPELADLLVRLGIQTLGALADLPPAQVLARFGPDGAEAHRLARGLDERGPAARTPPPDLSAQAELDPPAERVDTAAFVARSLADRVHRELARHGLACTRIVIEAQTDHGEDLVRVWRHDGALSAAGIADRVRWQLDGWLSGTSSGRPTAGITLLRLVPEEVRPDKGCQVGFWGGATLDDERAARALARVQGLLGPEAVTTAVLGGGRGPAEQVRLVPWGDAREPSRPGAPPTAGAPVGRENGAVNGERPPWPGQVPSPAPAVVHPDPLPAEVVDGSGEVVVVTGRAMISAPPERMSVAGGPAEGVSAWAGPWPVDERWWDPPAHRRRARLQVLTGAGTAYLVAVEGGRWWVEATYD